VRRGAADRTRSSALSNRPGDAPSSSGAWSTDLGGLSGGGAEPQPGPVGQPGHPLGSKDRRQGLQQVGHVAGGRDDDAVGVQLPQGTVAPWMAMMAGTWMSATPRTSSAWSASHNVVRRAETSRWRPCQTIPSASSRSRHASPAAVTPAGAARWEATWAASSCWQAVLSRSTSARRPASTITSWEGSRSASCQACHQSCSGARVAAGLESAATTRSWARSTGADDLG
jgi:hypothetical protein